MHSIDILIVLILWFPIFLITLYFWLTRISPKIIELYGRGAKYNVKYKYSIEFIFKYPSASYQVEETMIDIELIHDLVHMQSFRIDGKDLTRERKCMCLNGDIRSHFLLIRRKHLSSISKVRVAHNCKRTSATIYLKGIEITDQKYGSRIYYSVGKQVMRGDINSRSQKPNRIQVPSIRFWSSQVFLPNFYPPSFEDHGWISKKEANQPQDKGVILSAKMSTVEATIFLAFFLVIKLVIIMFILCFSVVQTIMTIMIAIMIASLISLLITDWIAIFYRDFVKHHYNARCSPMLTKVGRRSTKWFLAKFIFLLLLMYFIIAGTIIIPAIIHYRNYILGSDETAHDLSFDYHFKLANNQLLNLVLFYSIIYSLSFIATTFWLFILGIFRYIFRKILTRGQVGFDVEAVESDLSMSQNKTEEPKESVNKSASNDSMASNSFTSSRSRSPSGKKQFRLGTQILEREMRDKNKRLETKSVIAKPTKSCGFISPEDVRVKVIGKKK